MSKSNSPKKAPAKQYDFDAIIIGTGPGGEGTSMELSKKNKRVAIVERGRRPQRRNDLGSSLHALNYRTGNASRR